MAFKHQTESFRNRNGLRYECDGDICDTTDAGRMSTLVPGSKAEPSVWLKRTVRDDELSA